MASKQIRFRIGKPAKVILQSSLLTQQNNHEIVSFKRIKSLNGGNVITEDDILEEHFESNMWTISSDENMKNEPLRKKQKTSTAEEHIDIENTETRTDINGTGKIIFSKINFPCCHLNISKYEI